MEGGVSGFWEVRNAFQAETLVSKVYDLQTFSINIHVYTIESNRNIPFPGNSQNFRQHFLTTFILV